MAKRGFGYSEDKFWPFTYAEIDYTNTVMTRVQNIEHRSVYKSDQDTYVTRNVRRVCLGLHVIVFERLKFIGGWRL